MSLSGEGVRLLVGDHPRMDPIKKLDISPAPLIWGFMPEVDGVLDDHIETWYLTGDTPPGPAPVGTRDVVNLGLSQTWLDPPDRVRSDRMMRELSPAERVGRRPAPIEANCEEEGDGENEALPGARRRRREDRLGVGRVGGST